MEILRITGSTRITHDTLATVGFFDGVHRGHLYLIERMKLCARKAGLPTAIVTFPLHPRTVLQQDYQPKMLNSFDERMAHLSDAGIDYAYVIDFTRAFSETTAQDFIQKILHKQLCVRQLMIGYDHRFGKNRTDNYPQYAAYGQSCGMILHPVGPLPEPHTSSTSIRNLLSEGRVREAAQALSYPYTLSGTVIEGNHLGRTIGFPTANLDLIEKEKIIPCEGVYAVQVTLGGEFFRGMAYIGARPTVMTDGERRIEVNIFDFDRDIYGQTLRIDFLEFLRPDARFNGLDRLKEQLAIDRRKAIRTES
jgi:riboflavin kinase/FMN adenylyltransferase